MSNELSNLLKKLYDQDVIEPIEASLQLSPIAIALKKNKDLRMCIDLCSGNNAILVDGHPLPSTDDMEKTLDKAQVFSKLDLHSEYHQCALAEESCNLKAFVKQDGPFQCCIMSSVLAFGVVIFQRLMTHVMHGFDGVQAFEDNLMLYRNDKQ
ncbi:hypothetical protein NDU88_000163 [Pleurodeles waltl]|uniref:ribonuclease H n=1 Tax=Pleurodeles waltl TaxID=8319 RepID=A0AAV7S8U9_PLEWA|nr:hypothetical protein NDU88_000163 [Pleurodeles waltl]